MNIYEKLLNIQNELKCSKNQYNSFGKYKYRSCEDILEAVKPLCFKYNATLVMCDELIQNGERFYIKAIAKLIDIENGESIEGQALARESQEKKGMDDSQITGTASSYARKYALNGLFNIDDTKDADTDEYKIQEQKIDEKQLSVLQGLFKEMQEGKKHYDFLLQKYKIKDLKELSYTDYGKFLLDVKACMKGDN